MHQPVGSLKDRLVGCERFESRRVEFVFLCADANFRPLVFAPSSVPGGTCFPAAATARARRRAPAVFPSPLEDRGNRDRRAAIPVCVKRIPSSFTIPLNKLLRAP